MRTMRGLFKPTFMYGTNSRGGHPTSRKRKEPRDVVWERQEVEGNWNGHREVNRGKKRESSKKDTWG